MAREWARLRTRPIYVLVTLVFPLLSFLLLWGIFVRGVPRDLPVAVYDGDQSKISRQLVRMIDATAAVRVTHRVLSPEQGRRLVLSGATYALVIIPCHLQADLLKAKTAPVVTLYNNQLLLPGSLVSSAIRSALGTFSAGMALRMRQKQGESTSTARIHMTPVAVDARPLFNPNLNYLYFLLQTLLPAMLQIFIMLAATHALGIELREGTADDLMATSGGSIIKAVVGKQAPYFLIFLAVSLFMDLFLYRMAGVPLTGNGFFIIISGLVFILAYQSMAILVVALFANLRWALSMSVVFTAPAFAFAGITFPVFAMPLPARIWAAALPLKHYLDIMVDQALRGAPLENSLPPLGAMVVFVAIGACALPRLKTIMTNTTYWRKQ
jgi:ABC-2 type transport system permease protein